MVLALLVCLTVFGGLIAQVAAVTLTDARSREHTDQARWAADAAIEQAIWKLGRQAGGGPKAETKSVARSNDCSVEVTIAAAEPGRFRLEAEAVYAPEGVDDVRPPARVHITALVTVDTTTSQSRVASWTEN
jgi:uncharacterized cupin superfamily protein